MGKTISVIVLVMLVATPVMAGFDGPGTTAKLVTVASIDAMRNDAKVVLEGYLIKQLNEEHYIFKDDTGEIEIEIDAEDFKGATVTPDVKVRITGEVDKHWKSVSVDTDTLDIVK